MKLYELMKINIYQTRRYRRKEWPRNKFVWWIQNIENFTDDNAKILDAKWILNEAQANDWIEFTEVFVH